MGNEFILTGWFNLKNSQLLVDDGLKTCFNPSNYKRTESLWFFYVFWSKLKLIIEVNIYLILFLNTTHKQFKKEVKNDIIVLTFTSIIIYLFN